MTGLAGYPGRESGQEHVAQRLTPADRRRVKIWGWLGVGIVAAATVALLLLKGWPHNSDPRTPRHDAGTLITTFITLYALFLAGFGGLVGFVVKAKASPPWKVVAVEFLIAAAILDFIRIWDSTTHDLFKSATGGLTPYDIRDDINDFNRFFVVNVIVVAFAILAACIGPFRPAPAGGSDPSAAAADFDAP